MGRHNCFGGGINRYCVALVPLHDSHRRLTVASTSLARCAIECLRSAVRRATLPVLCWTALANSAVRAVRQCCGPAWRLGGIRHEAGRWTQRLRHFAAWPWWSSGSHRRSVVRASCRLVVLSGQLAVSFPIPPGLTCHPERSVRGLFRPTSFVGRADAQSKDLLLFVGQRCVARRANCNAIR